MDQGERQAMMKSMMEQCFGGMDAKEKKEMCAAMMGKMTEGLDMKEMMPMMMGMMSGGAAGGAEEKQSAGEAPQTMQGGPAQHMSQMPEMMLKSMMPHCIGMMLPAMAPEKRGEAAASILSAIVEKGATGMTEDQKRSLHDSLQEVLDRLR
ncbi:hypothetical protein [Pelagibius sp.]|uniref:hypothetical protein n=1 Tax=Pelagibius sp. TaxID=1931238 RepID=UPI0026212334|nr:hypothetical protein [Pelagibius sp.]